MFDPRELTIEQALERAPMLRSYSAEVSSDAAVNRAFCVADNPPDGS